MSNTFAGFTSDIIAQAGLKALLPRLADLSGVTTDFSSEISAQGETVVTRIPAPFTAATLVSGNDYASSNAVSASRSVTLDQPDYVQIEILPKEAAVIGFDRIADTFLEPMANAVINSIYSKMFNRVVAGIEATSGVQISAANVTELSSVLNFDRAAVAELSAKMSKKNVNPAGRLALTSVDLFANLTKDASVAQAFSIGGTGVIRDNAVGRLHGIDISETNLLPGNFVFEGSTADYLLSGVAATKDAFLLVNRAPAVAAGTSADIATATDPDSKFTFTVTKWFDPKSGKHYLRAEWLTGLALGNADAVFPIGVVQPSA